ncbi:MAG: DEAD/DEAH box helicase family protein [Candidatus Binatia bacterium]
MAFSLRPYQETIVNNVRQEFAKGRKSVLLVLPTGGGKTVCFSHIVDAVEKKKKRSVILLHREELVRQCSLSLAENGLRHRLIAPSALQRDIMREHINSHGINFIHPATDTVVASVQTLVRNFSKLPPPDLIVSDECHHSPAKTWRNIYEKFPKARILGVTATPERADGQGLGNMFESMVVGPSTQWLIDNGFLCKPIVYAPEIELNLTDVKTSFGDYNKDELEQKVNSRVLIGNAVSHYKEICGGVPAIAFCVSVAHAEAVAEEFRSAGYRAIALDGKTDKTVRKNSIAALGRGELDVVTSCDLISEGVDVPLVGAAILLRPTKSLTIYLQSIGRALRRYPDAPVMRLPHMRRLIQNGQHCAYILDHAGNKNRHGLPTAERKWSLEGRKKKNKRGAPERDCPECGFTHIAMLAKCPKCGFKYDREQGDGGRSVETLDGQLQEVTDTPEWAGGNSLSKGPLGTLISLARHYGHFKQIAEARGYKPGWAYFKWKEKQEAMQRARGEKVGNGTN